MSRVQVVPGGAFDPAVVARELRLEPLPIPSVDSPVLLVDGRVEPDATQWLAEVHARTAGTATAQTYADRIALWLAFLAERNCSLRGATRQHVISYVNARTVEDATRVSGATWAGDRTALKQFHTWLRETHSIEVPFSLDTVMTPRGPVESMREGRGVARASVASTPLTPPQIPELLAAAWRLGPDGLTSSETVVAARDAALISLGLACGARVRTLARLTVFELPERDREGDLVEMRLPGAIVKGRREVRLPAFAHHLRDVWSYADPRTGSRRLLLKGWQPKDPIVVAEVHRQPGRFWGVTDVNGNRYAFNDLTADQRARLVTRDGEPGVLLLSARTGGPLAHKTAREITGDVSRWAEASALARGTVFPHVHSHDLRATYATHLAALFMLGVPTTAGVDLHGRPHRVDVASAVRMASVGLGHLDEATTALYIQQVGLMIARYTVNDFLGRR